MRKAVFLLLILLFQTYVVIDLATLVNAHLTGGITKTTGKYKIQFLVLPKDPLPGENVTLNFSVQDLEGNNLRNVTVMITIKLGNATTFLDPTQVYAFGDFLIGYAFPQEGMYDLYIVVFDGAQSFPAEFEIIVSRLNRIWSDVTPELPVAGWISVLLILSLLLVRELRKSKRAGLRKAKTQPRTHRHQYDIIDRCG